MSTEEAKKQEEEKAREGQVRIEQSVQNLIENQMRQTSVQRGVMPLERDVEQWGMEKGSIYRSL